MYDSKKQGEDSRGTRSCSQDGGTVLGRVFTRTQWLRLCKLPIWHSRLLNPCFKAVAFALHASRYKNGIPVMKGKKQDKKRQRQVFVGGKDAESGCQRCRWHEVNKCTILVKVKRITPT